ncbi:uncharacterized protein N0V89_007710 [Didymosphaeria variabile]|uniref:Fatty acid hydroxylase domain-containing protein n=1 Tax=Didymosphaeria variabile TaxID=1932322 RepID=A0A9W9CAQ4_9PLEO|nr:uncharacterized protein N0V89_007710 [Didymosphaeria variabile]KAJ4352362.1 hypothetical protein N0V89_007710 [Didymosphaeria variabile]
MSLSALFAPITLPLASLFAIPMLSSWSTSINLVFISLTWTTIAMTYSPLELEFFGPLLLRTTLYILPSLLFLAIDLGVPSLALELKAQGERSLPGKQKGGAQKIRNVVLWSCFNVLLGVAIQAGIEFLVTDVLRMRSLLVIKGSRWSLNHLPNPWKLAKHLGIGIVSRNVLQYYIHRDLLHSSAGGTLAQLHQSWHHSVSAPYSFTANYDHPLPYLLHRFLPLYVPAIVFRFHLTTYLIMIALTSLEELFTYSGYNVLPSTIMLKGMARRVDAHMATQGKGNYGPLGVLDWVNGTTLGGRDIADDLGDEMDKHQVEERATGMADKLKAKAKKGKGRG